MQNKPLPTGLSILDKRLAAFTEGYRQNIALLGHDAGETFYLLQNYLELRKDDAFVYIHALTSYARRRDFFKSVIFSLLSNYVPEINSLDSLIYLSSPFLPNAIENIKNNLKKNDVSFLDILEIINTFINESKRRCIFIIEEFLEAASLFENFYSDFSKFIILQCDCMVILTASREKEAQRVLANELNLLFGNFEIISLSENSFMDNFHYLKNLLLPATPSPFFFSFFINILGSNCLYYDIFCPLIKSGYCPDNEEDSIIFIIRNALYSPETYCFQRFLKKIDELKFLFKDPQAIIQILSYLSQGYMRKKDLLALGIYDCSELSNKLQRLNDLNYIVSFGNIYKIRDSLFSFWLSQVFEVYFRSPLLDPKQRRSFFQERLTKEIAIFKDEFFTDSLKKILQLFAAFKNDNLKFGKTTYVLPAIERIKTISYPQNDSHLLIAEGKEIIFAGIKGSNADDNDIFNFIEKGANIRGKAVKKIFISLGLLSSSSRLIAKNHKITIWDIQDINQLLHIYNKPVFSYSN